MSGELGDGSDRDKGDGATNGAVKEYEGEEAGSTDREVDAVVPGLVHYSIPPRYQNSMPVMIIPIIIARMNEYQ